MKHGLEDILKQVKELNTIKVGGRDLIIHYYLGGDWKFLAMATGIGTTTSKYAGFWCKCPNLECFDTAQQ